MSAASIVRTLLQLAGSGENTGGVSVQEDTAATNESAEPETAEAYRRRIVEECLQGKEAFSLIAARHGATRGAVQIWLNAHYEANPNETRRHLRTPPGPPRGPESWIRGQTPRERAAAARRGGEADTMAQKLSRETNITHAHEALARKMRDPEAKRRIVEKRNRTRLRRLQEQAQETSTTTQLSRPTPPASQVRQQRLALDNSDHLRDEPEGYSGPTVAKLEAVIERQAREIEILRETAREALEERKTLRGMVEIMQREAAERAGRRLT